MKNKKLCPPVIFGLLLVGLMAIGCASTSPFNHLVTTIDLLFPADNATSVSLVPTFRWTTAEVDSSTGYRVAYYLFVSKNPSLSYPIIVTKIYSAGSIPNPSYTVTQELEVNTDYYWKVQSAATDGFDNEEVRNTDIWNFTTGTGDTTTTTTSSTSTSSSSSSVSTSSSSSSTSSASTSYTSTSSSSTTTTTVPGNYSVSVRLFLGPLPADGPTMYLFLSSGSEFNENLNLMNIATITYAPFGIGPTYKDFALTTTEAGTYYVWAKLPCTSRTVPATYVAAYRNMSQVQSITLNGATPSASVYITMEAF